MEGVTSTSLTNIPRDSIWVAISPDQKWLAIAFDGHHVDIRALDEPERTLQRLCVLNEQLVWPENRFSFSIDSTKIVCISWRNLQIWEVETGRLVATTEDDRAGVLAVDWSANGEWILSGGIGCSFSVYDTQDGIHCTPPTVPMVFRQDIESAVFALSISPNSRHFVLGLANGTVQQYNVGLWGERGSQSAHTTNLVLHHHDSEVRHLSHDSTGTRLVACYDGGEVRMFCMHTGSTLWCRESVDSGSFTASFSPSDAILAVGSKCETVPILVLRAEDGEEVGRLEAEGDMVRSIAFSGDGAVMVSVGSANVTVWTIGRDLGTRLLPVLDSVGCNSTQTK